MNSSRIKTSVKFALRLSFVAFISLSLSACTNKNLESEYSNKVDNAKELYEANLYADAISESNEAAKLIANKADAYTVIADSLAVKGRVTDLNDLYVKVEKNLSDKEKAKVYYSVGEIFYKNGQWKEALDNFKKSYDADSSREGVKFYTASSYLKTGEDFDNSIIKGSEKGQFSNKFNNLKELYDQESPEGLYEQALKAREFLLEGYPYLVIRMIEPNLDSYIEYDDGLYLLGRAYYDFGKYDKCIETLKTLQKSDYESKIIIGRCAYENNDYPELSAAYKNAYMLGNGDQKLEALREFLAVSINSNNTADAQEMLNQFNSDIQLEQRPLWLVTYDYQIQNAQGSNENVALILQEATTLLNSSSVSSAQKVEFYEVLIMDLLKNNQIEEAASYASELGNINNVSPVYAYYQAKVTLRDGNIDEGKSWLDKAIDYDFAGAVTIEAEKLLSTLE